MSRRMDPHLLHALRNVMGSLDLGIIQHIAVPMGPSITAFNGPYVITYSIAGMETLIHFVWGGASYSPAKGVRHTRP